MKPKQKAIFMDRDGTLIEEVNFLSRVEDLRLFPFTNDALKLMKDAGFLIVVVTNQSGIGRGLYDEAAMHAIHDAIRERTQNKIDGFYFCPHLPDAGCECRKPRLGMIEQTRRDLDIDMENSWFIGDKGLDIETGIAAGLRTGLVRTGYGRETESSFSLEPDIIADNILEIVLDPRFH
jgi:D-glycero-D-manno-heptose 1,7-bisphosphate phosphatase